MHPDWKSTVLTNLFVIDMTDTDSKLERTIHVSQTTALHTALTFLNNCIMPHGVSNILRMDIPPKYVCKFFNGVCSFLCVKQLTTALYHLQTKGKIERYNKTIVARSRQYVNEHHSNWNLLVQSLTYACSDKYTDSQKWLGFVFPWRVNHQVRPYRTFQLRWHKMRLNDHQRNSYTITSYIDCRSCK